MCCTFNLHDAAPIIFPLFYFPLSDQIAVLRENGRIRSLCPEETPMAMLRDIVPVLRQLKAHVNKQDEQMQQYNQSASSPAK